MSKLAEIQRAIQSLDPAGFQRLCDALLYARGYRNINPVGLVIGAGKVRKGTPDSLEVLPTGKYVFAEYTTQQSDVAEKLLDDLAKCFDESKTGVPADRIQHFIGCHTSALSAADELRLTDEGKRRGCMVTMFGIGPISQDLLLRFPGIARQFLNVELDTGQILTLDAFVDAYGKSAVATPLNTRIRFRDADIEKGVAALVSGPILIVAGAPGVGKTRLALEIARTLMGNDAPSQAHVVLYRGLDLFADVRTYFAGDGSHLIVVDDANRVSGFDHILHLLRDQTENRRVRIIATVRDYALAKVLDDVAPFGDVPRLKLKALADDQIREILTKDCGINHHLFLDRIVEIAQGNPRLAVMAARVANREQNLESLRDVSVIYDDYFKSIRKDLAELNDADLVRAAGVVALFRHVDRKNDEQLDAIGEVFGVTPDRLWTAVKRLHELEIADLYEDEVVRIPDQVLSTYLFHLAFFTDAFLDVSGFFHPSFFPGYKRRFIDALNPAASAFDGESITNAIRPALRRRWAELEATGNEQALAELVDTFAVVEPTQTLKYAKDRVARIAAEPVDPAKLVFKATPSTDDSLWSILGRFRGHELPFVRIAVELAVDLLERRAMDVPHALDLFVERFGVRHTSYTRDYEVQRAVLDGVWSRLETLAGDTRAVFVRVFLAIAEALLQTHFQTHDSKGELAITIHSFDAPATPALKDLRQSIWHRVGALLEGEVSRALAVAFVRKHSRNAHRVANATLIATDAEIALPLLREKLGSANPAECSAIRGYLQLLERSEVTLGEDLEGVRRELQTRCADGVASIDRLLISGDDDWHERREMGWEEYEEKRQDQLRQFAHGLERTTLADFLVRCTTLQKTLASERDPNEANQLSHSEWQLKQSIETILHFVASQNPPLFGATIEGYLQEGNLLDLEPRRLVPALMMAVGSERTYRLLTSSQFTGRGLWLTAFFASLPVEDITGERLSQMYSHYQNAKAGDLYRDLGFLAKYEHGDARAVVKVVDLLVAKAETDPNVGNVLADALNWRDDVGSRAREIFGASSADTSLLKQAYLAASRVNAHFDHDAAAFGLLLDLDPAFGGEWIDWRYANSETGYVSRHDDSRDYSRLWLRDDYAHVMRSVFGRLMAQPDLGSFSYADVFTTKRGEEQQGDELLRRKKAFFTEWIESSAGDIAQMTFVFGRISRMSPDDRRELLAVFLSRNQRFFDFKELPLEQRDWGWTGSQVPLLLKRVEFYENLLPLFDRIELLEHRQNIEERVARLHDYIAHEKRRDFLDR